MPRLGTYYAGRVVKGGALDSEKLLNAIFKASSIIKNDYAWTILDVQKHDFSDRCIIGELVKYNPEGEVPVVDNRSNKAVIHIEPDLIIAKSPFIYLPSYSGIAFLHVWNHIQQRTFMNRFCEIICESNGNFFTDCNIELITELDTFHRKISSMDSIYKVSAKVHPPNPLFGALWESLKEYLINRNSDSLNIIEENPSDKPINSNLKKHIASLDSVEKPVVRNVDISDAAVLMAADGYGNAKVEGKKGKTRVIYKTTDNVKSFKLSRQPDPEEFFTVANQVFEGISQERYMEH